MSDHPVQGLNRTDLSDAGRTQVSKSQEASSRLSEGESARSMSKDKPAEALNGKSQSQAILNNLSDVRLAFQVDPSTQHVTVLVVDKASKEVIRTIPPEDIQKMDRGDLVEVST